jgi:carbon-monoxide dehydrogenase large subunit
MSTDGSRPLRQRPGRAPHRRPGPGAGPGPLHRRRDAARAAAPGLPAQPVRMPHHQPSTSTPRAMPGVVAVYTGADLVAAGVKPMAGAGLPRPDGKPAARRAQAPWRTNGALRRRGRWWPWWPTARQAARAAADAVWSTTTTCRVNTDPPARHAARRAGAVGRCARQHQRRDAPRRRVGRHGRGLCRAAHTVSLDLVNQRLAPAPMEPRSVLAWVDDTGRLTVRLSSQMPTGVRAPGRRHPRPDAENVRVVVGDVGGGFGMKTGIYPRTSPWPTPRCS